MRAAVAAGCVYLDSTGEPPFIRRVFEEFGPPAAQVRRAAADRDGLRLRPGRAGGRAGARGGRRRGGTGRRRLLRARRRAVVPVRGHARVAGRRDARRRPRLPRRRACAACARRSGVRSFTVAGKSREAISVGGAEHFGLPAAYPRLREVNVYLGWFGPLARPLQAGSLVGAFVRKVPLTTTAMQFAGERVARPGPRARAGNDARRALLDRRRGVRRAGRQLSRGPPRGRRRLRVHRGLHGLGGAAAGRGRGRARAGRGVRARPPDAGASAAGLDRVP